MDGEGGINIANMMHKFDLMAQDLHLMAWCIDQLRIITIIIVATTYVIGACYAIAKCMDWREKREERKRSSEDTNGLIDDAALHYRVKNKDMVDNLGSLAKA